MSSQILSALPGSRPAASDVSAQDLALARRLRKLSRRTRQIFLLCRLEQRSHAEVAAFIQVDAAKVERAMLRAMRQAHRHLADPAAPLAIHDSADAWYIHLQNPSATPSQRIEFRHWLDADPAHLAAFQASERLWQRLRAPAALLGASGWHRRKPKGTLAWCLAVTFVCSLLTAVETFS
ncbi:DUF4880 domain-containing protein [Pseudomonas sp. DTU_2021_1001937_2_SI_NGA_ILE_001]|uniref:DUF4880 domain-containing protein n=1 Tax=Pseudomonas sp. DTU_2021_1001937_2_SI_NGA_ILE_001 TaxID=3077589 RepID=UPI0028FC0C13|nr:DUF4880 domain-containing protein [Pseudomonas sp. DTU_2021_1001937_2_SI_NGA_ILE_001]WNW10503.1 DUF4880 domain-containing protein [Pseudomonas sp. DTU_2021_1001937_2_SI_NGA_ILE_001]